MAEPTPYAEYERENVTLSRSASAATRTLAETMDCPVGEAIRRSLMLLDVMLRLDADEYLAIHNPKTGKLERLRWKWQEDVA